LGGFSEFLTQDFSGDYLNWQSTRQAGLDDFNQFPDENQEWTFQNNGL
jgi:hypothetical protein